jgi:CyaY protein
MDESHYLKIADKTFRTISDAFDEVDPDEVEVYTAGDVLTLAFKNGIKAVVNTQRPTRQIWLAANARAWHFDYDEQMQKWLDDKTHRDELFATLAAIVKSNCGVEIRFGG